MDHLIAGIILKQKFLIHISRQDSFTPRQFPAVVARLDLPQLLSGNLAGHGQFEFCSELQGRKIGSIRVWIEEHICSGI